MKGHYFNSARQDPQELAELVAFLKKKQIRSYLEIGSMYGGALWAVVQGAMTAPSRVVSVDRPKKKWDSERSLRECIDNLKSLGHDARLFLGDSMHVNIVKAVRKLAPFDAIMIDADHKEPSVRADFANYGKLSKIICFHDIDNPVRLNMDVGTVWKDLKRTHKDKASFTEISNNADYGIGILQWV